jgi:hypothetical protein
VELPHFFRHETSQARERYYEKAMLHLETTNPIRRLRNRPFRRRGFPFIPLAFGLAALALSPHARATCLQGCDGDNAFMGEEALSINGNSGVVRESAKIRIAKRGTQTNTFIAGITGVAVAVGVGVIVDTNGQLDTVTSSARFKDTIRPMDKASEAILATKPVTFHYKKELDPDGIPQFGLVAEDVAKVNPDLVARDDQGKPYTVRHEAVNAMLLNEFLKEHRNVEEQAAQIQKVSAQIEVTKPAPQMVLNNQQRNKTTKQKGNKKWQLDP